MNYILRKVNCKALIVAVLVVTSTIISMVVGYAYTMRKIPNFWFDSKYVFVAEGISPRETSYSSVTIDYDDLADLVYYCNEHNLSTSLVYNDAIDRYVGYVSDSALNIRQFNFSSLYGLLGNVDGKIYVAEDPRSHTNITITTPTNPDYTDRLINIASNLDFLPIIAELNVLIADNQLLVMDYIKLAIESIWDLENSMIDHIDDLNTTVNNRLAYIGTRVASIDNHVVGIAEQLGSVIRNGQLQVNTSPLEARLDKLISMYSKVNSVVLDTASINGGQITGAVGGELQDVIFWGDTGKYNNEFLTPDSLWYRLGPNAGNTTLTTLDDNIVLRSVNLGSTIPSYIANDPMLYAGVWQKGTDYIISDTYNASTGEYVQRVGCVSFNDLSLSWGLDTTSFPDYPYFISGVDVSLIPGCPKGSFGSEKFVSHPLFSAGTWGDMVYGDNYIALGGDGSFSVLGISASAALSTVEQLQAFLAGTELYFIRFGSVRHQQVSTATIAIPEGSSYISSYNVRITGKYETYESFTQTADIITAINNLQLSSGVGADLTAITTRLDAILAELQSAPGSATCEHTYTQHMEQEATCSLPGLMVSTCSKCGDSYSEIVDPLGHDWILNTPSAYDVYTCSRCQRTYEDHDGSGPEEDYSSSSISKLVVRVFSKLGTFAGKLIGSVIRLFDKAITALDNVVSKFNEYVEQISGFGGGYPAWLTGFWGVLPAELQVALTFAVICMALGVVGKKLFFS